MTRRFAAGERPESFDKDFVRSWVMARCDPYKDESRTSRSDIVLEAAALYIDVFETITGQSFPMPDEPTPVLERIRANLARYF